MAGPWEDYAPAAESAGPWSDYPAAAEETTLLQDIGQGAKDLLAGGIRGAGSIGATILRPFESGEENQARRADMDAALKGLVGADPESAMYGVGKIGAEIAGTAGAGGVLAKGAGLIPGLGRYAGALESFGTAPGLGLGTRVAAGAATGAASSAAIDPTLEQTGIGGAVGGVAAAALPPFMREATKITGRFYDLIRGDLAGIRAGQFLSKAAGAGGQNADDFAQRIATAPADLTAAQAGFSEGGSDVWMALGKLAEQGDAEAFRLIKEAQQGRMSGEMNRMARGATTEQTDRFVDRARQMLERKLGPVREAQIGAANIGREVTNPALQRAAQLEQEALQFGGTSAEAARLRQLAGDVEGLGFTPLDVSAITSRIGGILDDPKLGPSKNVSDVLGGTLSQVQQWVSKGGGVMDADALYTLRKTAVNETVGRLLAGADPVASKRLTAKLSGELTPLIDDAIESAGATGWKQYIQQYGKGLENIDRVELMGVLRDLRTNSPAQFMDVIKGMKPSVVQDIMVGKRGVEDAIPAATLDKLRAIGGHMERDELIGERAKGATKQLADLYQQHFRKVKLPPLLTRETTTANAALEQIYNSMDAKTQKIITEAMKSGAKAAELMQKKGTLTSGPLKDWLEAGGATWLARSTPAGVEAAQQ